MTFHNEVVQTNNYDDFERIQEIPISELHQRCHGNRGHAQDICIFTASYGDTHAPLRLCLYMLQLTVTSHSQYRSNNELICV